MRYVAIATRQGRTTAIEFPDCPGCQTFAGAGESVEAIAADALDGWLELHLESGEAPPEPRFRRRAGARTLSVPVEPLLAVRLAVRWARLRAGVSQGMLAERVGVTRQQISLLESRGANMQISTLRRIAEVLDLELDITFRAKSRVA